jgi:hypothetical protein
VKLYSSPKTYIDNHILTITKGGEISKIRNELRKMLKLVNEVKQENQPLKNQEEVIDFLKAFHNNFRT